jgi:enamine deaminase RidA (YjgF/YER057c/UK114 family)
MGDSMRDVISASAPGLDLGREYGHHQSPTIRAGGLIFCSGMVAINPESGEREHGTVTSEVRRIFENLKLLLQAAGSSLRLRGNRRHQVSQWTPCRSERDSNPSPPQDK